MYPPLFAVFSIQNNTEFTPAMPSANIEPTIMPDQSNSTNKLVVVDNARSSAPVVIDVLGQILHICNLMQNILF